MAERRGAVLGHPVGHSLSPTLHATAYAVLGLDWRYEAIDVTEGQLEEFLAGLDAGWFGLSLTMPLKTVAARLLTDVAPTAARVGSVNTVTVHPDGALAGDNTDIPGIVAALRGHGIDTPPETASILGGGATARSALAALAEIDARRVTCCVRRPGTTGGLALLAESLGIDLEVAVWARAGEALRADLVVATTPPGAADPLADAVPSEPGTLLDVVYAPWPTRLAQAWLERQAPVASGLDLLVAQAACQVERWTGRTAPVDAMHAAGLAALAR